MTFARTEPEPHDQTGPMQVVIVAFGVYADTMEEAQQFLINSCIPWPNDTTRLDSWWVAEDERYDVSDNDSAVFVKVGNQEAARALLLDADLAHR